MCACACACVCACVRVCARVCVLYVCVNVYLVCEPISHYSSCIHALTKLTLPLYRTCAHTQAHVQTKNLKSFEELNRLDVS